jgi:membrane-associated phospholipid phosphatase
MAKPYLIIFFLLSTLFGISQNDSLTSEWIVKGGLKDQAKLWSSPLRIKPKHLAVIVPLISLTGTALYFDESIYSSINKFNTKNVWAVNISSMLTYAGDGYMAIGISSTFYVLGHLTKNEKTLQTGALCYQAFIHSGIITGIGKVAFSRKRPVGEYGADWQPDGESIWHFFPGFLKSFQGEPQSNYSSFPSGHTSAAWSIATVVAKQYHETIWVPIVAYSLATAAGVTRMILNKHWTSDVIVGAAIGYGVGHFLFKNRNNTKWVLFPTASSKNVNLTGIYSF